MTPATQTAHGAAQRSLMVWRFASLQHCLSSAPVGGGRATIAWMMNATVSSDFGHADLGEFVDAIASEQSLSGTGVGFLTAANVARAETGTDEGVLVEATVGVTRPTWAADADGSHNSWSPGTINIVAVCPVALTEAAAVNAIATITEAKTQALFEAGVAGTGTASDAVAILWPAGSTNDTAHTDEPATYGGPRSTWGARIARATHQAVAAGLRSHP